MLRKHIIKRLNEITETEESFKTKWWVNNFISYEEKDKQITKHISEVFFDDLKDLDHLNNLDNLNTEQLPDFLRYVFILG